MIVSSSKQETGPFLKEVTAAPPRALCYNFPLERPPDRDKECFHDHVLSCWRTKALKKKLRIRFDHVQFSDMAAMKTFYRSSSRMVVIATKSASMFAFSIAVNWSYISVVELGIILKYNLTKAAALGLGTISTHTMCASFEMLIQ